jgi:hypothetical protein
VVVKFDRIKTCSCRALTGSVPLHVVRLPANRRLICRHYFSLNSAYIRAALVRAFTSVGRDSANVPQMIVYTHPTVEALSMWLWKELTGSDALTGTETDMDARVIAMKDMIRRQLDILADSVRADARTEENGSNGANDPNDGTALADDTKRVVLVTGTTGGLGTHLLVALLLDPSVNEVFALNRRSRSALVDEVYGRQRAAFDKRGIRQELLESSKLTFVDADQIEDIEAGIISRVNFSFRVSRFSG